jgi:hypothetical protein
MEKSKPINIYRNYDFNSNSIRKSFVNYAVVIFAFTIILIFILLLLYYLTPNNYELIKWNDGESNKFKLENEIEYIIKPDTIINIGDIYNKDNNAKYLRFSTQTNLLIKNILKSQNIIMDNSNELVKPRYNSEISLVNNSKLEKKILIQFYSLN